MEDAEKGRQRPKLEGYDGTVVLAVRSVHYDDAREAVETGQVLVLVGDRFVVTVRHGQAGSLAHRRSELEAHPERLRSGPAAVLHSVVDEVVDGYQRVLADLENDVEQIEEAVFRARPDQPRPAHLPAQARGAGVPPRGGAAAAAAATASPGGHTPALLDTLDGSRMHEYFRDVLDHARREADLLESLDRLLDSASDANASQVAMYQNDDQRKISAWAAIALVPTVVAGIYGMNFQNMPELQWQYGYPTALALIVTVCVSLYRGFRRNGWL